MSTADVLGLEGKVVCITGGAKGIGASIATRFAQVGASVAVIDIDATAGAALVENVSEHTGGKIRFLQADASDSDDLSSAIETVGRDHGRLDCLVNNVARFTGWSTIDSFDPEAFVDLLRVNVVSYFVAARTALPRLRTSRGSIVNIGSLGGQIGLYHDALYSASKGAIASFTKSLAMDESEHGVRVNAVLPGNVLSDARNKGMEAHPNRAEVHEMLEAMSWLGRSADVAEVAGAVLFLASELASYCTGTCLVVSGGMELGPAPRVRYS